jgi:hypothetical protein
MSITLRRPSDAETEQLEAVPGTKPGKGGSKSKAAKAAAPEPRKVPGARGAGTLTVGGEPRVDLLPPEVRRDRRARRTRRALGWGVLATVIVMVIAAGTAFAFNVAAQTRMLAAQGETVTILAQQQKFMDVRTVQGQVLMAQAAQQVGVSTEIDWKDYLTRVQGTLPGDVTIQNVTVDSSTPLATYSQSTAPLQGPRVATITFTASSPTLPQVPVWLRSLAKLPGYADATPGTISLDTTSGIYTVNITMHVNDAAFDKRFQPKEK